MNSEGEFESSLILMEKEAVEKGKNEYYA